jgi:DNA mismatch endonuclease (patch repair protein)
MDRITREQRSRVMSAIPASHTRPELILRSALHRRGLRFRLHASLPGKPDIVLPRHHLAIFVHGCFWHQHRNCKDGRRPRSNQAYWNPKFRRINARDQAAMEALNDMGYDVRVFWECEIEKTLPRVVASILVHIDKAKRRQLSK